MSERDQDRHMLLLLLGAFLGVLAWPGLELSLAIEHIPYIRQPGIEGSFAPVVLLCGLPMFVWSVCTYWREVSRARAEGRPEWPVHRSLLSIWSLWAMVMDLAVGLSTRRTGPALTYTLYPLAVINCIFLFRHWRKHAHLARSADARLP